MDNVAAGLSRLALLLGPEAVEQLGAAHVAVVGLGAVGSFATEALARTGIGALTLIDFDDIGATNLNRQLFALHSTIGRPKVEAGAERLKEINPALRVTPLREFFHHDSADRLLADGYDFLIDAIDGAGPKVELIARCHQRGQPLISAMGAAGRLGAEHIQIADISRTDVCPLCRVVRKRLGRRGIRAGIPVVYSREPVAQKPAPPETITDDLREERLERGRRRSIQPSAVFLPAVFGLLAAQYVVNRLLADADKQRPQSCRPES